MRWITYCNSSRLHRVTTKNPGLGLCRLQHGNRGWVNLTCGPPQNCGNKVTRDPLNFAANLTTGTAPVLEYLTTVPAIAEDRQVVPLAYHKQVAAKCSRKKVIFWDAACDFRRLQLAARPFRFDRKERSLIHPARQHNRSNDKERVHVYSSEKAVG